LLAMHDRRKGAGNDDRSSGKSSIPQQPTRLLSRAFKDIC